MTKYAHVKDGAVLRIKDLTAEEIAKIPAHKASYILPYIEVAAPTYDNLTQHPPVRQPDIIGSADVTQSWSAPAAKSPQEVDDAKTARATSRARHDLAKVLKVVMTGQFWLVNQVRALQDPPQAPLSVNAYFSALDGLPTLSDEEFTERIKTLL